MALISPTRSSDPISAKTDYRPVLVVIDDALHPSPIVVVGRADVVTRLLGVARNLHRLAGTLTANHVDASVERLAEVTKPVLRDYLSSREAEALDQLSAHDGVAVALR